MIAHRLPLLVLSWMFVVMPSRAVIINVPDEQPTIQAGIDAAVDGDTVLVAPGVYYENIHYREKGITVASHFLLDNNPAGIDSTVINGSNPIHPDTGSCVLIVSDSAATTADTNAALIGFTITGGSGTKWQDEHGAGIYREGGGILIQYFSPLIKNNVLIDNNATNTEGVTSAGGGAIRCGDGNPRICNNALMFDSALYGGGIVLNYTGAILKNNVIAYNSAGGAYGGGGGIWAYANGAYPKSIENNSIVYNQPGGSALGGGIRVWSTSAAIRNSVLWGNVNRQIYGSATVNYCDIQDTIWPGEGNIDALPVFAPMDFYLADSSPCIDAGDTNVLYNDPEDPMHTGYGLWPAMGLLRNDMGAYGGPGSSVLTNMAYAISESQGDKHVCPEVFLAQNYPNPFKLTTEIRWEVNDLELSEKSTSLKIHDVSGRLIRSFDLIPDTGSRIFTIAWDGKDDFGQPVSSGIYFYSLGIDNRCISRKMTLLR